MSLEEWKDVIGHSATFFTILQFLMGIQVLTLQFSLHNLYLPVCVSFFEGLLWFLQEGEHRRVLLHDIHSWGGDDICLVQLWKTGWGHQHHDSQCHGFLPSNHLQLRVLQLHGVQGVHGEEDVPDPAAPDPGADLHCQ